MPTSNRLECTIYVNAHLEYSLFAECLAKAVTATLSGPLSALSVHGTVCEIDIRRNPNRSQQANGETADEFLFFPLALEVYANPESRHEEIVDSIARILTILWSRGWPAIAACDFEAELPHGGGFNSKTMPWLISAPGKDGISPSPLAESSR